MKNSWIKLPHLISGILFLLVIFLVPWNIPKFRLLETELFYNVEQPHEHYLAKDLDNDGISEFVKFKINSIDSAAFVVYKQNMVALKQWDFRGLYDNRWDFFYAGDFDQNGYTEVYLITSFKDSLFLHILEPMLKNVGMNQTIFIEQMPPGLRLKDLQVEIQDLTDLDQDGHKDLIFSISAGFGLSPRKIFVYQPGKKNLRSFGYGYSVIKYFSSGDMDGDGIKEIFVSAMAPGNIDSTFSDKLEDSYSRVFVINLQKDDDIQPLMERFGTPGLLRSFLGFCNQDTHIMALGQLKNLDGPILYRLTNKGDILDSIYIGLGDQKYPWYFKEYGINEVGQPLIGDPDGRVFNVNACVGFEQIGKVDPGWGKISRIDLDEDGKDELIGRKGYSELIIYSNDFKHASKIDITENPTSPNQFHISLLETSNGNEILLHNGSTLKSYRYELNPIFYGKYPTVLVSLGLIFLFIFLIRRQQNKHWEKQLKKESEVNALQFQAISNQINPHFSFNLLNIIGYSIQECDKDIAYDILIKYSHLIRELIENSREIVIPLERELEFTRKYLELQNIRLENTLDYKIEVDDQVDLLKKIPKMIIHTFVENALKHGLIPKAEDRVLLIKLGVRDSLIHIIVEDNGVGRERAKRAPTESTGVGLKIINQIIKLYYDLYQKQIRYTFTDLASEEKSGTRVDLTIEV